MNWKTCEEVLIPHLKFLILYRYGGMYSDFDNYPGPKLDESTILPHYHAAFSSDYFGRPSQWFQMMEAKSPIAYFTMYGIFNRLQELQDVSEPALVFVTGPDALKYGFCMSMFGKFIKDSNELPKTGELDCKRCGGIIKKMSYDDCVIQKLNDEVPYPRGSTTMITVRQRIEKEMQTMHWQAHIKQQAQAGAVRKESCLNLLYEYEMKRENSTQMSTSRP